MTRLLLVVLLIGLSACAGYLPGRQAYWDQKLEELCAKDGGVQIFEKVRLTAEQAQQLRRPDGLIDVPVKELAKPTDAFFAVQRRTEVGGAGNVVIGRLESDITRRTDGAVVARSILYARSGGSFPITLTQESVKWCPEPSAITAQLQGLYIVERGGR